MKRTRSFDTPQPTWHPITHRPKRPFTDSLDGLIDNAIASQKLHLPYVDTSTHPPLQCLTPLLTTSANAFEDRDPVRDQPQTQTQTHRPFEKLAAEIDHILSPVTQISLPPPPPPPPSTPVPPTSTSTSALDIANILTIPALTDARKPAQPSMQARGKAMQEILNAIAAPAPATRRSSSAPTQCHVCGKTYTESSNLSKHIRTVHLKLRPFQCHLCSSSFAEKNKLGKHIQSVHEHARPYKCELCSATFSQASDRKRHRLVLHEGRRPFTCVYCDKAFGRRSSLTQHCSRVHKDEKPPATVRSTV